MESPVQRSGLEPELGGALRTMPHRSGAEPELGGGLRQKGVYVDEVTCIGCGLCAYIARQTFYLEPDYGRSRVIHQTADNQELIQEAMDCCPVDCIHWVDMTEVPRLEEEREYQVLTPPGMPPMPQKQRMLKPTTMDKMRQKNRSRKPENGR
ncbi:ferredoxin [Anthocerotibacter panamensis]|uniref:ferredoxin n=1 Tax=Anthocerotibacter panamensis TaxID=2857077 RepID=UPI001C401EDD|nr:ferredoxin [Anthocerotibacter panamensis]